MNLSISNIAWDIIRDSDVAKILEAHKLKRVDIAPSKYIPNLFTVKQSEIERIKLFWAGHGINVSAMQSLLYGFDDLNIHNSIDDRNHILDIIQYQARVLRVLGGQYLIFGCGKNRNIRLINSPNSFQFSRTAEEFFHNAAEICRNHGIIFCIEPMPKEYNCNFLVTHNEVGNIVKSISHPNLCINLDVGIMLMNDEKCESFLDLYGDYVRHIHLSSPYLKPFKPSYLPSDFITSEIVRAIKNMQKCQVSIEMLCKEPPYALEDIDEAIKFAKHVIGG